MIILKIKNNAGPGNQMFMYARAYSLARQYNQKIFIVSEISGYSVRQNILQNFQLDKKYLLGFVRLDWTKNQYVFRFLRKIIFDVILKLPIFHQIYQQASDSRIVYNVNSAVFEKKKLFVVDGYWECHEYFDKYRQELIQQFKPNYQLSEELTNFIKKVQNEKSIAVHIRKGDFQQFNRLMNDEYYNKAVEEFKDGIVYALTEDDEIAENWKKEKNAERIEFNTKTKYIDEWYAMSQCKNHIIANSTYSWWSAYLSNSSNKHVVVPNLQEYLSAEKDNNEVMYNNYFCSKHS